MQSELSKICKKYQIEMLILFGSQAKNRTHQESDIDLLFVRKKTLKPSEEADLYNQLYQIFKKKIDLVNLKNASPLLLGEIAKNSKLLYGNKSEFKTLQIKALFQYWDFTDFLKTNLKQFKNNLIEINKKTFTVKDYLKTQCHYKK